MMNVMFILLTKRTFPDIIGGLNSNNFSLACSKAAPFYMHSTINL